MSLTLQKSRRACIVSTIEQLELMVFMSISQGWICDVPLMTFYKEYLAPDDFPLLLKHAKMMACSFGTKYISEQLFS